MVTQSQRIKVKSLEFSRLPFRKLRKINIEFADRLTLIAGHNGIGKSTILGLVANTFGLTDNSSPNSYFGEPFYANIERIVYLALDEVAKAQENPIAAPTVMAEIRNSTIRKRCAMTQRREWKRARVVPRTIDKSGNASVGQDAKIPLPTIYLGLRRIAPIGEADETAIVIKKLDMDPKDRQLFVDFFDSVILGSQVTNAVTHQSIRGIKKKTAQPGYQIHDALAVSMGQDSLASIATALASFSRLKREMGNDYPGGLLVIDELDVGFHPHAIDRLCKELKTQAKRLDIQIIATTHSPRLIEAIHPEGNGNANSPDKVIYLLDTKNPRLAEDQSLDAILDDMHLREKNDVDVTKPVLCIYFEDSEAMQFCSELVSSGKKGALGRKYGVRIKLIPLGVGGSHLVKLPENDPIFNDRVLIVDADTTIPRKAVARGNTIKLPCAKGASGTDRSPENTIKKFLRSAADASDGPLRDALLCFNVRNPTSDKVLNTFFAGDAGKSTQRDSNKNWWGDNWSNLKKWKVIREWANCHQSEVKTFTKQFEEAVAKTAKRLTINVLAKY